METLSILRIFNIVRLRAFCVFNKMLAQAYLQYKTLKVFILKSRMRSAHQLDTHMSSLIVGIILTFIKTYSC